MQSVNDLLKYAASVDVRQRGPIGAQTDVSIRGGNSEQITILLNGINNVRINGQKMSGAVYTIDGRKVSDDLSKTGRLPKGLYVTNGRKFVVK